VAGYRFKRIRRSRPRRREDHAHNYQACETPTTTNARATVAAFGRCAVTRANERPELRIPGHRRRAPRAIVSPDPRRSRGLRNGDFAREGQPALAREHLPDVSGWRFKAGLENESSSKTGRRKQRVEERAGACEQKRARLSRARKMAIYPVRRILIAIIRKRRSKLRAKITRTSARV